MKPWTEAKLRELETVEWFCHLGQGQISGAKIVSTWMDAVVNCASVQWETVQRDAIYLHKLAVYDCIQGFTPEQRRQRDLDAIQEELTTGTFLEASPYLPINFPQWDRIREEIKPQVVALVTEKTRQVVAKAGLPDVVVKRATWDILCMALEHEFAEVVPVSFFDAMGACYLHGHFPCGWEGNWPEGQLMVY
ncbi:MAG: hypothetical protein U1F65_06230 [Verrucomicrobiota bacterium]